MRANRIAWVVASLLCASQLLACSSSEPGGGEGGGGTATGSGGAGTTSATSTSTSMSTSTSTSASGGGDTCGMLATYTECDDCECEKYQAGCDKYYALEDDKCFCGAGAPCAAKCTDYCGGGEYGGTCEACWNDLPDEDPCVTATVAACDTDPDCKQYADASDGACLALP